MEKVAVNLMNGAQGSILTIREGKALEEKHPERFMIKGRIESVRQYLDARRGSTLAEGTLQHIDKDKAVIIVNEEELTITLKLDPNNPFGTEVIGQMQHNADLAGFQINKEHKFSRESLVKLLTFSRRFFNDAVEWENTLNAVRRLKVSSTSDISQDTDNRGNKELIFKKSVDSANIPKSFILLIPIFKGQVPRKFSVDLCLEVTDAGVKFYLESVELVELTEQDRKDIINKELLTYSDYCTIWK
jgi:hypothetical protein